MTSLARIQKTQDKQSLITELKKISQYHIVEHFKDCHNLILINVHRKITTLDHEDTLSSTYDLLEHRP